MKVSDIKANSADDAGKAILEVYAKYDEQYAVYRTAERVLIQFADDKTDQQAQRAALATLNPLRGEINGLIDGWHTSTNARKQSNARMFMRRVADALVVGLEKDVPDALLLLQEIKNDILDKRKATGRIQYLAAASTTAVIILALVGIASLHWRGCTSDSDCAAEHSLWLAAAAGAAGAFFSVAVAIRSRTVLTDLSWAQNSSDATLRIVVGVISAPVLICLFLSNAVTFNIGTAKLSNTDGHPSWLLVIVVAFVAGFLERLVPDLLAKSVVTGSTPPPSETMTGAKAGAAAAADKGAADKTASDKVATDKAAKDSTATAADAPPDDDAVDGCLTGLAPEPSQATGDAQLPAAIGG